MKQVIYDGSKESVENIMNLLNRTQGILNSWDFNPPKLLAFNKFFKIGTEFIKKGNVIMTRDKTNFGYEIVDGVVTKTINWIDID